MGGRPGAPRALAVPTGPLGSAGPPQTAANIFSCMLERLTENWLQRTNILILSPYTHTHLSNVEKSVGLYALDGLSRLCAARHMEGEA